MSLERLKRTGIFPVRHHSPRSSHVLTKFLEARKPKYVLVEGPSDATPLIPILVDSNTEPPVALLAYRTDEVRTSILWPFASYSPEWVALRWARDHAVESTFIDVPGSVSLALPERGERRASSASPIQDASAWRGARTFEEFWEAAFEAPNYDPDSFQSSILAYAALVREANTYEFDRVRDSVMAKAVLDIVETGVEPEAIAVVVGAAHAAAFIAGDVALERSNDQPARVPSSMTIIPYSFPRLSEQLGYGAGNRAPHYYQRAHDAGCDYRRATLEVLVEFSHQLARRGHVSSLADTIEAYRLAIALAELRNKSEPGLDEIREASIATMCRGESAHADALLWPSVIGKRVGKVAARVGRNSLQEEFWHEVRTRRLPENDETESFSLSLSNSIEVNTSVFLHRLRISGIPYATFTGRDRSPNRDQDLREEAGGHAALRRAREVWEAQWTPATDVALVESIVLGESFIKVAERVLSERVRSARNAGVAAKVLLEAVVTATPAVIETSLVVCDTLSAADDDLPSLASAAHSLAELLAYGTSRIHLGLGDDSVLPIFKRIFDRAVLRVGDAMSCSDENTTQVKSALRTLHEIVRTRAEVDRDSWFAVLRKATEDFSINAEAAGLVTGLLYLAQEIDENRVYEIVALRLSSTSEAIQGAAFLAGFFEVNAIVLVKHRPIVGALDRFIREIPSDRFKDTLPSIRRAFSSLGAIERRYLLENIIGFRNLGDKASSARAILEETDKNRLREMSAEIDEALDALDEIL